MGIHKKTICVQEYTKPLIYATTNIQYLYIQYLYITQISALL